MYHLKRVETKQDWIDFLDLPWSIYAGNPNWVPPLKNVIKDILDVNQNPFFKHAYMYPVVAYKGGKCVGRIVGVIDDNSNRFLKEAAAGFGFFECINDQSLANLLLDEIAKWARSRAMETLRGPLNPSTNHECGLLIEGFDEDPAVKMTYNPPYYARLIESWGLKKAKDLFAYNIDGRKVKFSDQLMAQAEKLKQGGQVTIRTINSRKFDQEMETIFDIYNDAYEENWGFVPMEAEEFRYLAKHLKTVMDPELILIAEVRGEPAGFALALPDINQALKKLKDGNIFPTGLVKLIWNIKGPGKRSTINRCRILTLGIKKVYRDFSIGPLLYSEYLKRGPVNGYAVGEASWVLEDHLPMHRALAQMCGERTKTYRIYERPLKQ